MPQTQLNGGCHCGALRYRVSSEPFDAGYCHCRICQRSSGAPVLAFATVPVRDLTITHGKPVRRTSSDFGERWFCGDCGTQIAMHVKHQPDTIDFTIASLDDPSRLVPGFHIWWSSRAPWFDVRDELPRYEGFRPDRRGIATTPS